MHNLFNCKLSLWLKSWKSEHNKYPIRVGLCKISNILCICKSCLWKAYLCWWQQILTSLWKNREGQLSKTLKPGIISCIFNGLVIRLEFHRAEHFVRVSFWLTATNVPNNWFRWWRQQTWNLTLCCYSVIVGVWCQKKINYKAIFAACNRFSGAFFYLYDS